MHKTLYWLTKDLRIDDNAALIAAAKSDSLLCVYCIEPRWFSQYRFHTASMGAHRWQFMRQCLADLRVALATYGQEILFVVGEPDRCLAELVERHAIDRLVCSFLPGTDEAAALVGLAARRPELIIDTQDTYTLFDRTSSPLPKERVVSYSKFRTLAERTDTLLPVDAPASLPPLPAGISFAELRKAEIPDLSGYSHLEPFFEGGESAAKRHLKSYFGSTHASSYKKTRNELDGWDTSSKLSPWLNSGSLSARRALSHLRSYEQTAGANDSTYWLYIELLWREYFQWIAVQIGPKLFSLRGISSCGGFKCFYPERFEKWCQGTTPYPLVNACMKQLKATGYLSNRGRQIAASCLVNELEMDWRYGAAWFEHQLCDYDVASNWGNWQYIAGVGVDPRGGRHFNLQKQTETYDPAGSYIARWSPGPVLQTLDTRDAADWPIG